MNKLDQGQSVLLEIDVQGGRQVFEKYPAAIGILILPPSFEEMRRRLENRGRDDEATIQKRLVKAQAEVEEAKLNQCYQYTIVNDDLEKTIEVLTEMIGPDRGN